MKKRKLTIAFQLILLCFSVGVPDSLKISAQTKSEKSKKKPGKITQEIVDLKIGETDVRAIVHTGKPAEFLFFNMHDDENTSVEAAANFIAEFGGKLVELQNGGKRLIRFNLKNKKFTVDPNRIFTNTGAAKTLKNYGKTSPAAEREVRAFAKNLITQFLSDSTIIIAMHNNTEDSYTAKSYEKGGEYQADAAQVFIKPENDIDDFFFVTDRKHFDVLKAKGFNVVLQNNETVTDDGSLSVYCGEKKITYINVEAQHGHLKEQIKMLKALRDILTKPKKAVEKLNQ